MDIDEMLLLFTLGAVMPYLAEAVADWYRTTGKSGRGGAGR